MSEQDPYLGKVIDGRYEIQQRVGEGGMGVVYKARQMSIDRIIALKMLNQQMQGDQTWVQRFYNEAKACSRLQHPNTIRMFDFGQTQEGRLFMTMEFLDGQSLRDVLQRGPIAPNRVIKILIQCCASLAEAHSIGIIHRDIKPDNVFLLNMAGSPDFVKLLDFSVAKLLEGDRMKTQAGVVFGTPQYMSPEQGRGLPLDARSDLYALGVLAFEMLTGNVPYNDDNPMTVIQMHLHGAVPPMPDTIPYPVQSVVRRAMEKDPARRYQSAGEMMQHCQQVFAELNAGGVAIGGGGVPKTMIAPNPQAMMGQPMGGGMPMQPQGFPPPQQSGLAQPQGGGYQAAGAQAKTMIAQQSPFAGGMQPGMQPGMQQPGMQPPGMQPPQQQGFVQASPAMKTIVAGVSPVLQQQPGMGGGMPGMMPPGMAPQGTPGGGFPPQSGPQKTVMLQPSEGVVSVAQRGGPIAAAAGAPMVTGAIVQGASTMFWIVSLLTGVAVGVIAYVIVCQM
ncbi:MAG: serine/threonine protein kinase [Deltaproteobacteria bacterium]|nr:serine/threonine protein kinase [Deltaproteobacteria bacterium]